MPDVLHGLAAQQKSETVDALVHYLVSIGRTNPATVMGADSLKMNQGRVLYHQVGCVACHAPLETAGALNPNASANEKNGAVPAQLRETAIPLGNLAHKTTVPELAKFLMDPSKARPSGRMPSLNLTEPEATAIAMYLLREQAGDPKSKGRRMRGVSYQYFEGSFNSTSNMVTKVQKGSGIVDGFSLQPKKKEEDMGFRFSGFLAIPSDGEYTFSTRSDDGSRLYMDQKLVVENDGIHGPTEQQGKATLKAGEHFITVEYFNSGGGNELKVTYQAQGLPKQPIPASALSTDQGVPMEPVGSVAFELDATKASRGREFFASLGCASCHQVGSEKPSVSKEAIALSSLKGQKGCLAETDSVPKTAPKYELEPWQRTALSAALDPNHNLAQPRPPGEEVAQTMAAFSCFTCHSRDKTGGPSTERAEYFGVIGEADLGDEGRIPPHLTAVGAKLRPEWIREVLLRKGAVRPYMATRMPQFGAAAMEKLAAAFEKTDAPTAPDPAVELVDAKYGRKLVGTEGFSCISCHTFDKRKSLGIPAIDLTLMTHRLRSDWFRRYLLDPPSLRPGTRMPSFFPEGKSARQDILAGNTDRQIKAMWAYLGKSKEIGLPPGLVQGRQELVANGETLIYRNFIQGGGSRAIGVAYPEKANLAFDANDLRLAMIWQGPFIDAARHRSGRGEGYEPPLGFNVLKMPVGAPFARIENSATTKWPDAAGKAAGYQMRGYQLDEKRRPSFHYDFENIKIEDFPEAVSGELDASIRRTIRLHAGSPVKDLWFRAWAGTSVEEKEDGTFLVDGRIRLKLTGQGKPIIRREGGRAELIVPIAFAGSDAKLVEEIIW